MTRVPAAVLRACSLRHVSGSLSYTSLGIVMHKAERATCSSVRLSSVLKDAQLVSVGTEIQHDLLLSSVISFQAQRLVQKVLSSLGGICSH